MAGWILPIFLIGTVTVHPTEAQDECNRPLGMQSGDIQDNWITASSSYDEEAVGPQCGRIRTERNGGAWCPKNEISRTTYEWLEIDLQTLYRFTAVETQGRFGNGQGHEYAEVYRLEYQRQPRDRWIHYFDRMEQERFDGNTNTYMAVTNRIDPPIIARKIRIVPYSSHPWTVCMRVEVYGCQWTNGIVSYNMPQGHRHGADIDLIDFTYDGTIKDGYLSNGLGQLVDGERGDSNFRMDRKETGKKGYEWIGWNNGTMNSTKIELTCQFDAVRNFTQVRIHTNNMFSKDVRVFSMAKLLFSIGGTYYQEEPVIFRYLRDSMIEYARDVIIAIPYRVGKFVKILLYFDSKWLMISEVQFESELAENADTAEPSLPSTEKPIEIDLPTTAQTVAKETLERLQTNIEDVPDVYNDYKQMLPDLVKLECYHFERTQSEDTEAACELKILLEQLNIMLTSVNSLRNRQPRNLLRMKTYEAAKLLNEAHDFHKLLTSINFDRETLISLNETLGRDLGRYFKNIAKYDIQMASKDRLYIQDQLKEMKAVTANATQTLSDHLVRILKFAVGIISTDLADKAVRVALAVVDNSNPLEIVTNGFDFNEVLDSIGTLISMPHNLTEASNLLRNLQKFEDHLSTIKAKFAVNTNQMNDLKGLVEYFDNFTDVSHLNALVEDFLSKYGDYTPKVTMQDLTYIGIVLEAIADAACNIIADSSGTVASVAGILYESANQDCTYIGAYIAKLMMYYDDWFSFQFDLADALANIACGTIAQQMAQKISDASNVIDVKTAAIGSMMVEIKYQAASQARCNILEYHEGGKRPDICKRLLFSDDDIQTLIAYKGSVQSSETDLFAYVPTYDPGATTTPYVNVDRLLSGDYVHFQLPLNDKAWMTKYGWLPNNYNAETAFFVKNFEVYIPGLRCNNGRTMKVRLDVTTGKPAKLYAESALPSYIAPQHIFAFEYSEGSTPCAGTVKKFPEVYGPNRNVKSLNSLCVSSEGKVSDHLDQDMTLPSLFASYTIKMRQGSCNVVHDTYLGYVPLVTIKLKVKEVFVKIPNLPGGIDECWPDPCPSNQTCVDGTLSYTCEAKHN